MKNNYQELFNYISEEHNVNLVESEMQEIERIILVKNHYKELLEVLKKSKSTISRLKSSMMTHPDHTIGSEFDDYTSLAEDTENEIDNVLSKALRYVEDSL